MRSARAVVLGASMAGLLAARVLADFFDTVLVVERDALPLTVCNRRGVPQGRHVHVLWGRGCSIIEGLFPGFVDGLLRAGAPYFDGDLSTGLPQPRWTSVATDGQIRRLRVRNAQQASTRKSCKKTRYEHLKRRDPRWPRRGRTHHDAGRRFGCHYLRTKRWDRAHPVEADLVIDATGRGGRTPAILENLGYGRPAEDSLDIRLMYSSLPVRLPSAIEGSGRRYRSCPGPPYRHGPTGQ